MNKTYRHVYKEGIGWVAIAENASCKSKMSSKKGKIFNFYKINFTLKGLSTAVVFALFGVILSPSVAFAEVAPDLSKTIILTNHDDKPMNFGGRNPLNGKQAPNENAFSGKNQNVGMINFSGDQENGRKVLENIKNSQQMIGIGNDIYIEKGSIGSIAIGSDQSGDTEKNGNILGYDKPVSWIFNKVEYTNNDILGGAGFQDRYIKTAVKGYGAVAIGSHSQAQNHGAISVGTWNMARKEESTAIGTYNWANAKHSIAMGTKNIAYSENSVAFGYGNTANGVDTTSIGVNNTIEPENFQKGQESNLKKSLAVGVGNVINTTNSAAIGLSNKISKDATGSFIFGQNATSVNQNSIVLGYNSTDDYGKKSDGTTIATKIEKANINGVDFGTFNSKKSVIGALSIGNKDATRKIIGVAAGRVASDSNDAINGSQLYSVAGTLVNKTKANADEIKKNSTKIDTVNQHITNLQNDQIHFVSVNKNGNDAKNKSNYNNDGAKNYGSIALGLEASANNEKINGKDLSNIAIGTRAEATNPRDGAPLSNIAIGYEAKAKNALADNNAQAASSIAIGHKANAETGIAIGEETDAQTGWGDGRNPAAIAIGTRAVANSTKKKGASLYSYQPIAIGYESKATHGNAIALGGNALAKAEGNGKITAIAIGDEAKALKSNSIAIGYQTEASSGNNYPSISIGYQSKANFVNSISMGYKAEAISSTAISIGEEAKAGNNSIAIGRKTGAQKANSIAFGNEAQALEEGSVAIGQGSVANSRNQTNGQLDGYVPFGEKQTGAIWNATHQTFAVGNDSTLTRQISGVAAGVMDTDAVNVAQLKNSGFKISGDNKIDKKILNGEKLTINTSEKWTNEGTRYVGKNLQTYVGDKANVVHIGMTNNPEFNTITIGANEDNLQDKTNTDNIQFQKFGDTLKLVHNKTEKNKITQKPVKLTNLADGEIKAGSTDAITGGQLKTELDNYVTTGNDKTASVSTEADSGIKVVDKTTGNNTDYKLSLDETKVKKIAGTTNLTADLANKADKNAGNLEAGDVTSWQNKLGIDNKADKTELTNLANTDLSNITDDGKTTIKNLAKGSVEVKAANGQDIVEVAKTAAADKDTYTVSVNADKLANNDAFSNKFANKDASNIADNKAAWETALGLGDYVKSVTGDNFIEVDNADKQNPKLSLNTTNLAGDKTFVENIAGNQNFTTKLGDTFVTKTNLAGDLAGYTKLDGSNLATIEKDKWRDALGVKDSDIKTLAQNSVDVKAEKGSKIKVADKGIVNGKQTFEVGVDLTGLNGTTYAFTAGDNLSVTDDKKGNIKYSLNKELKNITSIENNGKTYTFGDTKLGDTSVITNKDLTEKGYVTASTQKTTSVSTEADSGIKVVDKTTGNNTDYKLSLDETKVKKIAGTTNLTADLANKADKNAGNLEAGDVTSWQNKLGIDNKADKTELTNLANTDLSNITDDGKTTIKNLAKGSVEVKAANGQDIVEVAKTAAADKDTYTVSVNADKLANNDAFSNKFANKDASNIADNKAAWETALGLGDYVKSVTGDNFIEVDNADKQNPKLSLNTTNLAGDKTFVENIAGNQNFTTKLGDTFVTKTNLAGDLAGYTKLDGSNLATIEKDKWRDALGVKDSDIKTLAQNSVDVKAEKGSKIKVADKGIVNGKQTFEVGVDLTGLNGTTYAFTAGDNLSVTDDKKGNIKYSLNKELKNITSIENNGKTYTFGDKTDTTNNVITGSDLTNKINDIKFITDDGKETGFENNKLAINGDGNIKTSTDKQGKINISLGDKISFEDKDKNKIEFGKDGLKIGTTGPSVTKDGINGGNKVLTNLASGLDGRTLDAIKEDIKKANGDPAKMPKEASNAATIGDLAAVDSEITNINTNITNIANTTNIIGGNDNKLINKDGTLTDEGEKALTTNAASGQDVVKNKNIIQAINNINKQGTRFFHVNDGTKPMGTKEREDKKDSSAGSIGGVAIGIQAEVGKNAANAIAIGTGSKALAKNTIAIGNGNSVEGKNSGAIGDPNVVKANNSFVYGNNNTIETGSDGSFVIGNNVKIDKNTKQIVALGENTKVSVAGGVALGSGSVANRTTNSKDYYIPDGATADKKEAIKGTSKGSLGVVSVGEFDGATLKASRQITGVAAGTEDSDAVNVAQLKAVVQKVANQGSKWIAADNQKFDKNGKIVNNNTPTEANGINSVAIGAGSNTKVVANGKVVERPNTVSVGGINKDGTVTQRTISNVAPGVLNSDAATMGQLRAGLNDVYGKLNKYKKQASAGTASAMAIGNMPQSTIPGKGMMSLGSGYYDGQSAMAIGLSKMSDDGKWVFKGSASYDSQEKAGGALSIGYHF